MNYFLFIKFCLSIFTFPTECLGSVEEGLRFDSKTDPV